MTPIDFICAMLAAVMPLEWNAAYPTATPYELELNPAKLERLGGVKPGSGFVVRATTAEGEQALPVVAFKGRLPGDLTLRFGVPAGATALALEAGVGTLAHGDAARCDNLFAGGTDPSRWTLAAGAQATPQAGGVLFETIGYRTSVVYCEAEVPAALAGQGVKLELDLESLTPMTWGGCCALRQFNAAGEELPEGVVDPRWISHMRPRGCRSAYREKGRLHPQARKVRMELQLRSVEYPVDAYGLPRSDADQSRAKLLLSHLALRPAATLPFPKFEDCLFAAGVSGRPGDTALALGGEAGHAFYYQTHSQASWAEARDLRDESLLFYPNGAGTVEAWFKPDWPAFMKKSRNGVCRLFHTQQNYMAHEWKAGKGAVLELSYQPARRLLAFTLKDFEGRSFDGSGAADLPSGEWTHVAAQFTPGGRAEVFVGGRRALAFELPGYAVCDLKSARNPNDQTHMEFFLGCDHTGARARADVTPSHALFEGAADLLRVSTGARYAAGFTPARELACDDATRALFAFDRAFDGVSGGGAGFVPGTTRALTGRVAHTLAIDGRQAQYFPAAMLPAADPGKTLNLNNYPDVPDAADFAAARVSRRRAERLANGGEMTISVPERTVTDYVEIANLDERTLDYPALLNHGDLDVRSFADAADSLALGRLPDRERANRLFQFVIGASDYFMGHQIAFARGTDAPREVLGDPLVMLNAYCGFECGPLNNLTANLFACAVNCPAGQTAGYGHSFEQVFYDGKNHIYDLSSQCFFPAMDNETAASLGESEDETGVYHRIGKSPDHFVRRSLRGTVVQNPGYREKMGMRLRPGERFRVWFANDGEQNDLQHCPPASFGPDLSPHPNPPWLQDYTDKVHASGKRKVYRVNRFFPDFANGFLVYAGRPEAANPAFARVEADSFCYAVECAFPIVAARYAARLAAGGEAKLEISSDGGKTFRPLPAGLLRYEVRARHAYLVRVRAPIAAVASFDAMTEVMVNRRVFPGRLAAGENRLRFRADSPAAARVVVAWREPAGEIAVEGALSSGFLRGAERQLVLVDPARPAEFRVTGASAAASARGEGVAATLGNGVLRVSAQGAKPRFASVTIADALREKELTVLVCPGARLATADKAALGGGAELLGAGGERAQACAMLRKAGDSVRFAFDPLPKGRYMVFQLERFEGGEGATRRPLVFADPANPADRIEAGGPNAIQHDFMNAVSGRPGGRAAFKWDAPADRRRTYHVSWMERRFDFPAFDHLTYSLASPVPSGVEVAAALVVPDPDEDFYCALVKMLCGMNCAPYRVKP